jgi:hypothetical protein
MNPHPHQDPHPHPDPHPHQDFFLDPHPHLHFFKRIRNTDGKTHT